MKKIKVENLVVKYRGVIEAVKNICFSVKEGEVLGILGPNGAGKTTILKAIAKLVDYKGAIYIDGVEVTKTPMKTIARIISYASDIKTPDFMPLSVKEALLMSRYPKMKGFFEKREDVIIVDKIMKKLDIQNLSDRKLSELSSGELRKVVIAMALAKEPKYILLDEPDSHLDLYSKVMISNMIKELAKDHVIVFTSHDILFTINTADHILLVKNGIVVKYGSVEEVVKDNVLEKVYNIKFVRVKINGRTLPIPVYLSS